MRLPGFQAEAAIYRSPRYYATLSDSLWSASETTDRVAPSGCGAIPESCATVCTWTAIPLAGAGFAPHDPIVSANQFTPGVIPSSNRSTVVLLPKGAQNGGGGGGTGGGGSGGIPCPKPGPCDLPNCMRKVNDPCRGTFFLETCCGSGFQCENDKCVCPAPNTACGTALCTNLQTDPSNCGACGTACTTGQTCQNGQCLCPNGLPLNTTWTCGSCSTVCTSGQTCQNGQCLCPDGQPLNTSSDCGICGNQCPSGAICSGGTCTFGVGAHSSDPLNSPMCRDCGTNCDVTLAGCITGAALACAPLASVGPFGPWLYVGCVAVGTLTCSAADSTCRSNCNNIGSPCCPVACGGSCCASSETCSDTGAGLCCSPGTAPCGTMCCLGNAVCMEGQCCPVGSTVCPDGKCCDNICNQCQGGHVCR